MELFIISVCAISFGVIAYRFEQMRADIKYMKEQIKTLASITSMESDAIDKLYDIVFPDSCQECMGCDDCVLPAPKKPLTKGKK